MIGYCGKVNNKGKTGRQFKEMTFEYVSNEGNEAERNDE